MRALPVSLSKQCGVAVVTALLLATLAVTIVASLFWQQQVQVRSIENQRLQLQKGWILRGALDWASMILRAGGRQSTVDDLGQPWATPLAETRLDQYVEDGQTGDNVGDAVLSGGIIDAQSRYNLNNLSLNGVINPVELAIFGRLLINLRLPPNLAMVVAQGIANGQATVPSDSTSSPAGTSAPSANGTLPMMQIDDLLALPGFSPQTVHQLTDYVVLLPEGTPVNVNTAAAELIAARFPTLSMAQATTLVAVRRSAPFMDMPNLSTQMKQLFGKDFSDTTNIGLSSNYFLVTGKVRMGRATLNTTSLIQRTNNRTGTSIVWVREY
ncbi:type II secretion system minor pseudopilin GspK [Glaciimonas immobilis]|uniref:Type II secretion system protein K n=1 Tax=Glaciimonas immobilis TaxID=728004 RepID=A0A840RX28_9BURK|nr:type II secretion system minor pseudopilin GspK [Glaciimonas immobilis]KAF3996614.1 type II secretion system minor pseudopilin GspK [Glaciimonas immobilis]MBB5201010.1 general secretion pathway protein K [Glaciimonas immobilis]